MAAVDEFDLAEASDDDGGGAAARAVSPRRPHPWPWVLAALALIGVGAVNVEPTAIVLGQGQGADLGLLELDIAAAPTTVWETPMRSPETVMAEGGRAVVISNDARDPGSVLAIDLGTGAEVWRFHDADRTCGRAVPIVCVSDPGSPEAALVTIALEDGNRRSRPHPGAVAAVAVGADLVVIEATDVEIESIVLVEPDGTERWRVDADAADTTSDPIYAQMRLTTSSVIVDFAAIEIDLATGEPSSTTRWPLGDGAEVALEPGGPRVVTTADGRFELHESEAWLDLDDDLGGPIVLQHSGDTVLAASRRIDGTELWQRTEQECYPYARLRGTLLLQCLGPDDERVIAVDLLSGRTRWELENSAMMGASEDMFLVADVVAGTVLAVDAIDGSALWSLPVPVGSYPRITELSDGVILTTDNQLIRLQWE